MVSKMQSITFVIFTFNEEERIERVIKNLKDYGKILLADDSSTDRTHEIAKAYGCDIYIREKAYDFSENQELVDLIYQQVTTDWVYWGFADEMLDKETLVQISAVVESNKYDIINIDRKNYFYGEFCYDLFHSRTNKIFKKGAIDFTGNVIHEMGKPTVDGNRIYTLPDRYFVHHFISNTASSYLNVINTYTNSELESKFLVRTSVFYFIFLSIKIVLRSFFFNKGHQARFSGLALTELMLFYALIKNMKHYEKNNNLNRTEIESRNNNYRDNILKLFI